MGRGEEFEELYNRLDAELRRRHAARSSGRPSFDSLVKELAQWDSAVRANESDLREFGDLRNAIVHSRGRRGIKIHAEPVAEIVEIFRSIVESVVAPKPVMSLSGGRPTCFEASQPLIEGLDHMQANDFSQIVVKDATGEVSLLTATGVTRWVQSHVQDGIVLLDKTVTLKSALAYEQPGSFDIIARTENVFDVQQKYKSWPASHGSRLHALLITNSGRRSETPLGIVTPWDLAAL